MSYTPREVLHLIHQGESELVEFKANVPERTRLSQYIAGFTNAEGGVILIGVGDAGEVVGIDPQMLEARLVGALQELDPVPSVTMETVPIDGKTMGVISIGKSPRLVISRSGIYTRQGVQFVPMAAAQITELVAESDLPTEVRRLAKATENLSATIGSQSNMIEALRQQLEEAGRIIEALRQQAEEAGRFGNKMKEWLISGAIGAILGVMATFLLGG